MDWTLIGMALQVGIMVAGIWVAYHLIRDIIEQSEKE